MITHSICLYKALEIRGVQTLYVLLHMNGKNKSVKLAYWFHVALSAFLLAKPNAHDIKWVWLFQVNLRTLSRDHVYNSACAKLTESRPLIIQLPVQKIPWTKLHETSM